MIYDLQACTVATSIDDTEFSEFKSLKEISFD